jgi:hypothetical protein
VLAMMLSRSAFQSARIATNGANSRLKLVSRNLNIRSLFFGANPRIRPFSVSTEDNSDGTVKPEPGMEAVDICMMRESLPVTFANISRANVAIRSGIKKTTCEKSFFLSELIGANVFLKTEFRQFTGSFKERGARNAIMHHLREHGDDFKNTGAVAASAGNHALALAYHGMLLDVPVTVVMPTIAPMSKVDKCRVSFVIFIILFRFKQGKLIIIQFSSTNSLSLYRTCTFNRNSEPES